MVPSYRARQMNDHHNIPSLDSIGDDDSFELLNDLLMREEEDANIAPINVEVDPERHGMSIEVEPSPGSSVSSSNRKGVSPIYTDYSTDTSHPSLGSARGVDSSSNQLIYSSSQTPHGFNVITKRKSTKKSVFNFEELDLSNLPQQSGTPHSSDQTQPDTGRSPVVDHVSSAEDSPEVMSRRILRTRPRNNVQAQQQLLQEAEQQNERFSEVDNIDSIPNDGYSQLLSGDYPDDEQEDDYKEYDEDFKNQLETAGSLQSLTLDTNADFDWSLLCEGALGAMLQSPTPRNPRKKQGPGMHEEVSVASPPPIPQQQVDYMMQQQQQQPIQQSYSAPHEYYDTNQSYNSVYYGGQSMPMQQQVEQQHWQSSGNGMTQVFDAPIYVKPEFPMSLPSISTLQASSSLLGGYNSQFPPVPSAPSVSDANYADDSPINITISNTALPLATALNEMVSYQHMVQRKVQEMKYHQQQQQQQSQHNGMLMQGQGFHPVASASSRPVSGPSGNTLTLQYTTNMPSAQQNSSSRKSAAGSSSSKRTPAIAKADSHDEDDDSNVAPAKKSGNNNNNSGRASKSLAEISRRFVTLYGKDNTMDYISGLIDPDDVTDAPLELHRVDGAADALGVHVRRIYELIKILEILSLVTFAGDKRGKFSWKGTKNFLYTLGNIQHDGITNFPQLAAQNGLVNPEPPPFLKSTSDSSLSIDIKMEENSRPAPYKRSDSTELVNQLISESITSLDLDSLPSGDLLNFVAEDSPFKNALRNTNFFEKTETTTFNKVDNRTPVANHEEHFMVEIICRRFLQLFLVGMNSLSMSSAIQKLIPLEPGQSLADYNKVNATKIRRVYDVTNVLCSLNLIRKKTIPKSKALKAELENNIDCGGGSEQGDFTDDCESQSDSIAHGKKGGKSVGAVGKVAGDRADTKVLEWTSFPPLVIRRKYLALIQAQAANGKKG